MHAALWGIYDVGGKNAILGFFGILGLGSIITGWFKTKELKALKNEVKE